MDTRTIFYLIGFIFVFVAIAIFIITKMKQTKTAKVHIDITKKDLDENKELISYDKKYRNDERIKQYITDIIKNEYNVISVFPEYFEFDDKRINILENGFEPLSITECFVISDIIDDKTRSYINYEKQPIEKDGQIIGHSLIRL